MGAAVFADSFLLLKLFLFLFLEGGGRGKKKKKGRKKRRICPGYRQAGKKKLSHLDPSTWQGISGRVRISELSLQSEGSGEKGGKERKDGAERRRPGPGSCGEYKRLSQCFLCRKVFSQCRGWDGSQCSGMLLYAWERDACAD